MRKDDDCETRRMHSPFYLAMCSTMLFLVILGLCGCGGGGGNSGVNNPVKKVLASIAVQPSDNKLAVGKTQQFTALCVYTDGSTASDPSIPVTWSSSSPSVATITPNGMVTAVAAGQTTISATVDGITPGTTTLTVPAITLVSITITPSNPTIAISTAQQFTATGAYSDGTFKVLTSGVTWASSDTSKATITTAGKASAIAAGSTTISATSGSISGTATLSVSPASVTLQSIAVTPANPATIVGISQQFIATGTFSNSTTQDLTAQVTWNSSDTSIATIAQNGKASAVGPGSAIITATSGGISGTVTLTVAPLSVTLQSIAITPSSPTIAVGVTQQFSATGTYSNNTTQDLSTQVTWSSSSGSIAGITQDGKASAVAVGTTTISATLGGVSGSQDLVVTPATVTGTWEGTYTIYEAYDQNDIGTYTFKLVLTKSGTSVTGTSSLRYNMVGQLAADGTFTEGNVTGNRIDFTFSYIDPRFTREMVNIGTATFNGASMTGTVLENYNGGWNCSYSFSLKKL